MQGMWRGGAEEWRAAYSPPNRLSSTDKTAIKPLLLHLNGINTYPNAL